MQAADPREVIFDYLLHSTRLGGERAQPGSIAILTARETNECIFYIVTYVSQQQQQLYVNMKVCQVSSGSWEFAGWGMMGGAEVSDLPQKPPPQLAWFCELSSQASYIAVAVLPNEIEVKSIRLKERGGHVFGGQLENAAIFFVLPLRLQKPINIEIFDDKQRLVSQKTIGAIVS